MAYPRQFDEPARTVIRVRVTSSQRRELALVARENHTTIAGVMREATDEFVSDYRENNPVFGRKRRPLQPSQ